MKRKSLIFLSLLIMLTLSACSFDIFKKPEYTPQPTPSDMEWYTGDGMSIMLPPSYKARNVQDDLPKVIDIIKRFTGGEDGLMAGLLDNVEQNVAWWGWDSETLEENPLRLLVIKNKALHALPITVTAFGLERMLDNETTQVEQTTLRLGKRSVVRFKYIKEDVAWIAYAFKEEKHLWLCLFIFTPEGLIGAQESMEASVGTIQIDVLEGDGN